MNRYEILTLYLTILHQAWAAEHAIKWGGYYEAIAYSYCKIMQDNSGHTL